jgi:type IX secretion system PorP/SprF family membrane protein
MKKIFTLIIYIAIMQGASAQQYPLFTNYLTNCFGFNPAVAATSKCVEANISHRQQWTGVAESPKTSILSLHSRVGKKVGVGGYLFNDQAGSLNRTGGSASLCYAMKLDSLSYFGIGVTAGYYNTGLGPNARLRDQINDLTAQAAQGGKNFPDFNAGVYFKRKGLWAGFSAPQVFERKLEFANNTKATSSNELKRHYFLMAGYELSPSQTLKLEPSGMLRYVENAPLSFDVSLKATFNNSFWAAINYRNKAAMAAILGMTAKNGLKIYYAYDYTTSSLNVKSAGTHEIGLGMSICKRKKDKDGDGIPDDLDKCPDKAGTKEFDGCPDPNDTDGDGVKNKDDQCPDEKGTAANNGCPDGEDTDGDGIPDSVDKCPEKKGTKANKGCPDKQDTDGDGVPDSEDQCPNFAGSKDNKGCPFADRDNDGLRDDIDKCPDVPGTAKSEGCPLNDRDKDGIIDEVDPCPDEYGTLSNYGCPPGKLPPGFDTGNFSKRFPNARPGDMDGDGIPDELDACPGTPGKNKNGCPVIPTEGVNVLDFALRNLYFDTDKAEIKIVSNTYLDGLVKWMTEHPEYKLKMQGHTDSRNTYEYNMELSKNRVYAVLYYLQDRGITPSRVKAEYFGETRPIATNVNEQGRKQNRRVDMQWDFD